MLVSLDCERRQLAQKEDERNAAKSINNDLKQTISLNELMSIPRAYQLFCLDYSRRPPSLKDKLLHKEDIKSSKTSIDIYGVFLCVLTSIFCVLIIVLTVKHKNSIFGLIKENKYKSRMSSCYKIAGGNKKQEDCEGQMDVLENK